jgi:hypothetical protein
MNIGLFAMGLDLMPDLGYPPVQYGGGWAGPKALWYRKTPAHNTVTIDGQDQKSTSAEILGGRTTLWALGEAVKAVRVSAAEAAQADRFERTVALIDVSTSDSYVLDIFRVAGGRDHARFMRSHFGSLTTSGLALGRIPEFGFETQMRDLRGAPQARPGWSADWKVEDRYGYRPAGGDLHLRLTDLTSGAQAATAESWISASRGYDEVGETWIPTVMVRRQAEAGPLESTFVGVIEPYEGRPLIRSVRRLPLRDAAGAALPDGYVALEITLADGRRDVVLSAAVDGAAARDGSRIMALDGLGLRTDAELVLIRTGRDGRTDRVALARGTLLELGDTKLKTDRPVGFLEISLD